jgi:hypothetical protein
MKKPISLTRGAVFAMAGLPLCTFVASILMSVNIAENRREDAARLECESLALEIEIRSAVPSGTATAEALLRAYSDRYAALGCPSTKEK